MKMTRKRFVNMLLLMVFVLFSALWAGAQETGGGMLDTERPAGEVKPAVEASTVETGTLAISFAYTTEQGANRCGNAGSYTVFLRTEDGSRVVKIHSVRDSRETRVEPADAGVAAVAERGEKDTLVVKITTDMLGKLAVQIQQHPETVASDNPPMYDSTIAVELKAGDEIEIEVPTETTLEPKIIVAEELPAPVSGPAGPDVSTPVGLALENMEGNARIVANVVTSGAVATGMDITLDASQSTTDTGRELSFEWKQLAGAPVEITDADKAKASFNAVKSGLFRFQVKLSDGVRKQYGEVAVNVSGKLAVRKEPRLISSIKLDIPAKWLFVLGNHLVALGPFSELQALDVTDPISVVKSQWHRLGENSRDMVVAFALEGSYLYLVNSADQKKFTLMLFDLEDPMKPKLVGKWPAPEMINLMFVSNGTLRTFQMSPPDLISRIYDAVDFNGIREVSVFKTTFPPLKTVSVGAEMLHDSIIGPYNNKILKIDLSRKTTTPLVEIAESVDGLGSSVDQPGKLYVFPVMKQAGAGEKTLLWTYEITDSGAKRLGVLNADKAGMLTKVEKTGDYLFSLNQVLGDKSSVVNFIDVGKLDQPSLIGRYHVTGDNPIRDIAVSGDFLYTLEVDDILSKVLVMKGSS